MLELVVAELEQQFGPLWRMKISRERELYAEPMLDAENIRREFGCSSSKAYEYLHAALADGGIEPEMASSSGFAGASEEIGALLTAHFAPDCIAGASNSVDSAGKRGRNGRSRRANSAKRVPRGGIEPPTRGFSVPVVQWPSPRADRRKRNT